VFRLRGTATAYVELGTGGRAEIRRIRIRSDADARLQLSLIPLASQRLDAQLTAQWRDSEANSEGNPNSPTRLEVWIAAEGGREWQVEYIACERNGGETRESRVIAADELRRCELPAGATGGRARGFWLPALTRPHQAGPLLVKAVLRDASGLRTSVWTEVEESASPPARELRFAAADGRAAALTLIPPRR
jgi:hypothetical protein